MKKQALAGLRFVVWACIVVTGNAQNVDLGNQGKNVDFTKMPTTKPIRSGTSLSGNCTVGEFYLKTDDDGGAGLYLCSQAGIWSKVNVGSGTGPMIAGTGIAIAGSQVSVEDAIVSLYYTGSGQPALGCNPGRDRYVDTASGRIYICTATNQWSEVAQLGLSNQWVAGQKQIFGPNTNVAGLNAGPVAQSPASLADGDIWYDTSAARLRCQQDGATVDCTPTPAESATATWNDEFTGVTINSSQVSSALPWQVRAIATGCGSLAAGTDTQHPGTLQVPTGAGAGMGCQIVQGAPTGWALLAGLSGWEFRWMWKASAVTGARYRSGFIDPSATPPSGDGIWISLDTTTTPPALNFQVQAAGVAAAQAGPTPGALGTTWYTLRIRSKVAGTWLASVAQNGGPWSTEVSICPSGCTVTSALPVAAMSPFFEVQQPAATGSAPGITVDAWKGILRLAR